MGISLMAVEAAEVLRWQAFDQEVLYKIYMLFVEGADSSLQPIKIIY